MTNDIIGFYLHGLTDDKGRTLEEILQWSQNKLEVNHDYIQWLFPLDEPSDFNPDAPLLTEDEKLIFKHNGTIQNNMRRSFYVLLEFLGLVYADGIIDLGPNFEERKTLWLNPNHNWLRITRILKSLNLCGLKDEAKIFFGFLSTLRALGYGSEYSFKYWEEAMKGIRY